MWEHDGSRRPPFAEEPGEDQESVWDYPRPPAIEACGGRVEVLDGPVRIAGSTRAFRVLETASPPTLYIPPDDVQTDRLLRVPGSSYCEWKGAAVYWALARDLSEPVAWSYPDPEPAFEVIRDHLAFYPGRIECRLDDERVRPQGGGFYGGWVTDAIVGPWKGEDGTGAW